MTFNYFFKLYKPFAIIDFLIKCHKVDPQNMWHGTPFFYFPCVTFKSKDVIVYFFYGKWIKFKLAMDNGERLI